MKATHQEKSTPRSCPSLSVPKKVRHSAAVIEIDVDQKATMDACFPCWAYSLAAEYNQGVAITWAPDGANVKILKPDNDLRDHLRETIGAIIGRGVGRAVAAKVGAANDAMGLNHVAQAPTTP